MAVGSLAVKLSDEFAVTAEKASRFVDDVGPKKAQQILDDLGSSGSRTLSGDWWKPVAATGAVGGGALAWRQQDVAKARALAERGQNYEDAMKHIVESDLPADLKRAMVEGAMGAANAGAGNSGGSSKDKSGGLIPDDPATLIVLVIVMALVLKFALEGDD